MDNHENLTVHPVTKSCQTLENDLLMLTRHVDWVPILDANLSSITFIVRISSYLLASSFESCVGITTVGRLRVATTGSVPWNCSRCSKSKQWITRLGLSVVLVLQRPQLYWSWKIVVMSRFAVDEGALRIARTRCCNNYCILFAQQY